MYLVVGKRGKGKSTFVKRSVAQWRGRRVLAWDPHDEHSRGGRARDQVELGRLRNRVDVDGLLAAPGLLDDPELSLAVVPSHDEDLRVAQLQAVVELLVDEDLGDKDLVFVVDEVFLVGESPAGRKALGVLGTQSRHVGVALVLIGQRATHIPPNARSQATAVCAFRQDHPADLDALAEVYGLRGRELAELVGQLEPRHCIVWFDDARQADFPLPLNGTSKEKRT